MTLAALGDSAYVIGLDGPVDDAMADRIEALAAGLVVLAAPVALGVEAVGAVEAWPGLTDVVPAFATVALFFVPGMVPEREEVAARVAAVMARAEGRGSARESRTVELPVAYGGEDGPDLAEVAAHTGLTAEEVIARHAGAEYRVQAMGFAPGFPYLGGLPAELAVPRRSKPRTLVPAGAVGIGGAQTGVYPFASPGGWNLIGRTSAVLFDARREPAALLRTGDRVRFVRVEGALTDAARGARRETEAVAPTVPERRAEERGATTEKSFASMLGAAANECAVERAGVWTTVQDAGRRRHRAEGVPLSGACDAFALRVANLLVGNAEDAAALEVTLVGPELVFARDTVVALGGAECEALPAWQPWAVRAGEVLRVGRLTRGCRGVLAVAGGIAVERVLGSASTYTRAQLGGVGGREVRAGDRLPLGEAHPLRRGGWTIDARMLPGYGADVTVRVVAGAQAGEFGAEWREAGFRVTAQSDRMGARLEGGPLVRRGGGELRSAPVVPGTVQVPPDGQPIVLLAEAQTIGGYPQLAHVVSVDLPVVAQLRPGDRVRFCEVEIGEARELARAQERAIGRLRQGLARVQV